jgi:hypothetical protein
VPFVCVFLSESSAAAGDGECDAAALSAPALARAEADTYWCLTKLLDSIQDSYTFAQVRRTPSWPRSWASFSLLSLYSHRNARANSHILGQPNSFVAPVMSVR